MFLFVLIIFLLLAAYGVLVELYHRGWEQIPEPGELPAPSRSVSVVVAVRNEAWQLPRLIDELQAQEYPPGLLELILVDDHSEDASAQLVASRPAGPFKLRWLNLPDTEFGKKRALARGIEAAQGDYILTTDADCRLPASWAREMVAFAENRNAWFLVGPVAMDTGNGMLGLFQALDFMAMQAITGGAIQRRLHRMGSGASLAYPREAFIEAGGFEGIDRVPTGDDMLLMQKIFERHPRDLHYLKSRTAIVHTPAEKSWTGFLQQRIRWSSKTPYYRDRTIQLALALTYLVSLGLLAMAVLAGFQPEWAYMFGLFWLAKVLVELPLMLSASRFFGFGPRVWWFVLMQPLHWLYVALAGTLGLVGRYRWKGRKI